VFPSEITVGLQGSPIGNINVYPVQRRGYQLLDAWLNFNLGGIVPTVPLIIVGRYTYGLKYKTYQKNLSDTDLGKQYSTMDYLLGIGWQFNKNVRILLGGEIQRYMVKKNRYLAYSQGTNGTEYYNASVLGLGNVFVGSHNPHDAKRVYIKAEVAF
jgi:hypothetical protein